MKDIELSKLLEITNADGAIIANTQGELLESENIDESNNIAGMLGVLVTMCEGFTDDLQVGKFRQIILKADEGVFIADKLYEQDAIVGLYSKDSSKGGMIKLSLDKVNKK